MNCLEEEEKKKRKEEMRYIEWKRKNEQNHVDENS